jgi:hypothetical protein
MRPLAGYAKPAGAAHSGARIVRPDKGQRVLAYCGRDSDVGNRARSVASVGIVRTTSRDIPIEDPRDAGRIVAAHLSVEALNAQRQYQGAKNYNAVALCISR